MGSVSSLAAPATAAALAAEVALRATGLMQSTELVLVSEDVVPFLKQQRFSPQHTVLTVSHDEQLLDVLERELRRRRVSALHLIGHGSPGAQCMGGSELSLASITQEQSRWRHIGEQLEPEAELFLYGCCVGADDAGATLHEVLADVLATPIWTADHPVGPAHRGGSQLRAWASAAQALVLDGLSICLHTDSVGFDISNIGGVITLNFFYGSWHSGGVPQEGALSLFTLRDGGNADYWADYSVEAYGNGGVILNQTFPFQSTGSGSTAEVGSKTLLNENSGSAYSTQQILDSGFTPGTDYFWDGSGALRADNNGRTYDHQWATIENIAPGTYRAFYDNDPVGATRESGLSVNWDPQPNIQQMIFSVTSTGNVVLGHADTVSFSGVEDSAIQLSHAQFESSFTGTLGKVKITSLPTNGQLVYTHEPVVAVPTVKQWYAENDRVHLDKAALETTYTVQKLTAYNANDAGGWTEVGSKSQAELYDVNGNLVSTAVFSLGTFNWSKDLRIVTSLVDLSTGLETESISYLTGGHSVGNNTTPVTSSEPLSPSFIADSNLGAGLELTPEQMDRLSYLPDQDVAGSDGFKWLGEDITGGVNQYVANEAFVDLAISGVNDLPTISAAAGADQGTVTLNHDVTTANQLTIADPDFGDAIQVASRFTGVTAVGLLAGDALSDYLPDQASEDALVNAFSIDQTGAWSYNLPLGQGHPFESLPPTASLELEFEVQVYDQETAAQIAVPVGDLYPAQYVAGHDLAHEDGVTLQDAWDLMLAGDVPAGTESFAWQSNDADLNMATGRVYWKSLSLDEIAEPRNFANFERDNLTFVDTGLKPIPSSGDFTVSVWANADNISFADSTNILSQGQSTNSFYLGVNQSGSIRAGDAWNSTGVQFPDDGEWHNLQLVSDAANDTATLYLDGVQVAQKVGYADSYPVGGTDLKLGKQYGVHYEHWTGGIDDVQVFTHALTPAELQQVRNGDDLSPEFLMSLDGDLTATYQGSTVTATSTSAPVFSTEAASGTAWQSGTNGYTHLYSGDLVEPTPTETVKITISGDNIAPDIVSSSIASGQIDLHVNENVDLAINLQAQNPTYSTSEPVAWALSGQDSSIFELDSSGNLLFKPGDAYGQTTFDYENPVDSDSDNTYAFNVSAVDLAGNASSVLPLQFHVVDMSISSATSATLPAGYEELYLTGTGDIDGTGNPSNNLLVGTSGMNILDGLAGDDTLNGGDGMDYLYGGLGDDVYIVNQNYDELFEYSSEGVDAVITDLDWQLSPNIENLILTGTDPVEGLGTSSDNHMTGNTAANLIEALAGNDTLEGGGGADTLDGGEGDDHYVITDSSTVIIEESSGGVDTLWTSVNFMTPAFIEKVYLLEEGGDLNVTANDGDHLLVGNSGDNRLDGGAGDDTLEGGAGDDTYVLDSVNDQIIESGAYDASTGSYIADDDDRVESSVSVSLRSNEDMPVDAINVISHVKNWNGWEGAVIRFKIMQH